MAERLVAERLVGERIGSRFVIDRLIGAGPLSSAFRARDELLQRRVTVKLFHPQHRDDVAVVEAQLELASAVARLSHPNIVTVIDRGEHEGLPFVVLEYVRGENLQERIDRYAPLRVGEVVGYGVSIGRALAYAHAQGVVHGNLRPGNVLISEDREVKLVDFGGGSFVATLTRDPYVAPERRAAPELEFAEAASADDVYALGVLLFAALTEHAPPAGERIDAARVQMLRPDASPRLAAIVARAAAHDPDERFAAMHELAAELASVRLPTTEQAGARTPGNGGIPSERADLVARPNGVTHDDASLGQTQAFDALAPIVADDAQRTLVTTPSAERGTPRRHRDRTTPASRQMRARVLAWSMVLLPIAALVLVGLMVAGERGSLQRAASPGDRTTGPLETVPVAEIASFDPPPGDGSEKDELIANLVDGNVETAWQTEGYNDEFYGKLKPGVGFYVTLREPAAVRSIRFETDLNGWTAEVYAADLPGEALTDWELVAKPQRVLNKSGLEVDTDEREYKSYLVWVTRLAVDDKFRARASEVAMQVPAN